LTCKPPFLVPFNNQSSGPGTISYTWNFGNSTGSSQPNPTATYNAPGTYTVTLNAVSNLGCTGSIEKTITINGVTTDFIAPTEVCLNSPVNFQNNSSESPVTSTWNFGDNTISGQINPIKTFIAPGDYEVTLVNQYSGCRDSVTKTITVNDKPQVDFTVADSSSCSFPFTANFTDLTIGATSWLWDFGDGNTSAAQNPSHTYNAYGDYTVTLTASVGTGCSNTIVKTNLIKIRPVVITLNVPSGGCIPYEYTPSATITTVDSIASYLWNFGVPGGISTAENPPPFTYTNAGTYTVSLTVTTEGGCTQTLSVPGGVLTGVRPIVNFSFNPQNACASDTILFSNSSVVTPGAEVLWNWNFGDGGGSDEMNPSHVFMDTGLVTVMLIVSNNMCIDSLKIDAIVRPPVAIFEYDVNCVTKQVTFRDTSLVDPTLTPISYFWEMGDPANTTFNVRNPPPFSYPGPGTYIVSLTVSNGPCSYVTRKPVIIANEPADFTIDRNPICKDFTFNLSAINSNPATIRSYLWIIGQDTVPGTERTVPYQISTSGSYDVTLVITDVNGCVTRQTKPNYLIVNGPEANFIPSTPGACLNKAFTFTDLSTPAGGIVKWNFDFGDNVQQEFTAPPFTHTYAAFGSYSVSLTVTDAQGCTDTYRLPTNVTISNPIAGFRADTFYCPAAPLAFVDTSSGIGLNYQWYFGDGNSSTLANPANSYPLGDNEYDVKLVITDQNGCKDSVTKEEYIKIRSPKSAFSIKDTTSICPPLRTSFTFEGSDYESFYWTFGDLGLSTQQNPTHFYSTFGSFTPTLILVGPGGCRDSSFSNVTIHNPADVEINYGPPTTACNSLNVDFNLVVPPGFKFHFHFGDGSVDSSGATTFSHFYSRPSKSQPRLILYDTISGCQVGINGSPRIDVLGAIPLFGQNISAFCDSGPVIFRDFTTKNEPIISTVWDFDDGTQSNDIEPTHQFTEPGTYIVTLNVTTQSNCSNSYSDTIFVYRTPIPQIQSRDTICVNSSETFIGSIAVPDSVTFWKWNSGNGSNAITKDMTATYNGLGDFTVELITTNLIGCADTTEKQIHVIGAPTAAAVQNPLTINVGTGTDLLMTYTGNISSYNWTPSTNLSCTDCPIPFATPLSSTTYTVAVENVHGCQSTGDITVHVVCNGLNYFVPNTFSPNGDGQNDIFYPRGTGLFRIKSFVVFNRWGEVVFERKDFPPNDRNSGWNGMYKGQPASSDVYVYMMEILCDNNTVVPLKGNVTLLR
jgi:gliding motility-associated-like protein